MAIKISLYKTTSPQGDGNKKEESPFQGIREKLYKTTSPQGDGNCQLPGIKNVIT
ncbi:hypothetical protein [Sphaerospermopsis aphanizomenoides]|uniref:hypothetical protein n=1 Tax=Sphaerospermopsis aphanizomenoides TaxID=459663 RepID=UPI00398ADC8E